jgi:FG-GAP repeat protein/PKD domain-containing protein
MKTYLICLLSLCLLRQASAQGLVKLIPQPTSAGDWVVSGDIDGDLMVIGSLFGDGTAPDSGSAFVYRRGPDGFWEQEANLVGSDVGSGFWFGKHVAIDGNCIVVGSPQEWLGAPTGDAYVFRYDGSNWQQEAKLSPSDAPTNGRFGAGVSIDGDYIIVGAYVAFGTGRAYIYHRENGVWVEQASLAPPDPCGADSFASHSVGIRGDLAVVGSRYDNEQGVSAGAAFVYRRTGQTWAQEQKLLPADGVAGACFGWWTEADTDRIIVGAPFKEGCGAAYIFERTGSGWEQTARLVGGATTAGDNFGYWTSIRGDWALVGARYADVAALDAGAAYLFHRTNGVWTEHERYAAPDAAPGDQFGHVCLDEQSVLFGALGDDNEAGIDAGAAYAGALPVLVPAPVANFWGGPLRGKAPLTVFFGDLSTGAIDYRLWDFGNGYFSTVLNPVFTFHQPGIYSISLTVLGPGGGSSLVKQDYVEVLPRGPSARPAAGP